MNSPRLRYIDNSEGGGGGVERARCHSQPVGGLFLLLYTILAGGGGVERARCHSPFGDFLLSFE